MLKGIGLIYRKEMWTAFREKRTLIFLLVFPLVVWPAFTMLPMLLFGGKEKKAQEETSRVVLIAGDIAPEVAKLIEASDRLSLTTVDDLDKAIGEKETDCIVYLDSISSDGMVLYSRIQYDATRVESRTAANKMELLLSQYEHKVVSQRLEDQGIDEKLLTAVSTKRENLIEDTQMIGFYLGMFIGMFIVMGSMIGGSSIIIDSTAGEKERKSLELLLSTPISRGSIMLGKYLAGMTFAVISPILTAVGMTIAGSFIVPFFVSDGASASGIDITSLLSINKILTILAVVLLMAAFVTALLMAIAVRCRTNKQAQTFMAPLNIMIVIPALFMNIIPASPPTWMFMIPFMNVMLFLRGVIMDNLPRMAVIYTLVSSVLFLFIALRSASRGFGSEKVLLK
jgi:sodium transport system permease protein